MSHKHSKYKDKYSDVIITKEDIEYEVDREKICPFLIRVFYNENDFSSLKQFDNFSFPSNELQIYTWDDANLRELTTLISGELTIKNIEVITDNQFKGAISTDEMIYHKLLDKKKSQLSFDLNSKK